MARVSPSSREAIPGQSAPTVSGTLEDGRTIEWAVAEEVPVSLTYNGSSSVVMMATPADLEDFAYGFSLTEEMVDSASDIDEVLVSDTPVGLLVDILTRPGAVSSAAERRRAVAGRTGCGLCGIESLEDAVRTPRRVRPGTEIDTKAIARAFDALRDHQPLNRLNRSVHAAAWATPEGEIVLAREDVGRHNALDKLIGALIRAGRTPGDGFIVMSSRCSFELVQKAAFAGVPLLATISAPTTLALELATASGMQLAALSPDGVVMLDH